MRTITTANVADHLFVANLRGNLRDIRSLGRYFDHLHEGRFKLIVLDAFYRALPAENYNAAMAGVYNALARCAETLGSAFVLVHHISKGNQSLRSITDVGAGAGSQGRATDTHLVQRPHEEEGAIVLDAALRSWPPIEPFCLRWNLPVWTPGLDLDPTSLRNESRRRRVRASNDQPTAPECDAERFTEAFVGAEPKPTVAITTEAKQADPSERKASERLNHRPGPPLAVLAPTNPFRTQPNPSEIRPT